MAQKDPLAEYRAEGHAMFNELRNTIREEVVLTLFHAQIEVEGGDGGDGAVPAPLEPQGPNGNLQYAHETAAGADAIAAAGAGGASVATAFSSQGAGSATTTAVNEHKDVGRNDPCWCGSGKKFKRCHGA
jgi:preprotein translocase subunit SecA